MNAISRFLFKIRSSNLIITFLLVFLFLTGCQKDEELLDILPPSIEKEVSIAEIQQMQVEVEYLVNSYNEKFLFSGSKARGGGEPPIVSRGSNKLLKKFYKYLIQKRGKDWYNRNVKPHGIPKLAYAISNRNEAGINITVPIVGKRKK